MTEYVKYVDEDSAALYVDGKLVVVGDEYHADSKIAELVGVKIIYSDAFFMGGNEYKDVAKNLSDIEEYSEKLEDDMESRQAKAAELREEARKLLEEADKLSK